MRGIGALLPMLALTPVLIMLVVGVSDAPSAGSATSLRVTYWEDGLAPGLERDLDASLQPTARFASRRAVACRRLAAGGSTLFAPIPPDTACTEIYGGPQQARVVGTISGKRIWTTFTRTNGCEIGRWNRLSPWLLPPGGARS